MLDRLLTSRLRPVLTLLGLSGFLALAACGGGSGAPNNPYAPGTSTPDLVVAPTAMTVYSGVPATVTITSGVPPFFAFSSNSTVLPVAQNVGGYAIVLLPNKVTADTDVVLTVQDSNAQQKTVTLTVKAAPIFNALTFLPSSADCGANLCSGQTGTATVVATGPGGAPLASRQIRFDVVFGPIGIATSNPAQPLAQTLTVATDLTGTATAAIQALANAVTQPAQIRATDVTSGQEQIANFTVVNNTVAGQSPLVVVPPTATITGALTTSCSTGFRVDYYVYGGNPPYTVSSTFPSAVTLTGSPVPSSGRFFSATTNGTCVNPLVFTIVDSAGKQTTAQLVNQLGTVAPPAPSALVVIPPSVPVTACGSKTFTFIANGGTPPYNLSTPVANPAITGGTVSTQVGGVPSNIVPAAGGSFDVTFAGTAPSAGTIVSILIIDAGSPQLSTTATINCNGS